MKCPCPCHECGELAELHQMKFNTHLCDCARGQSCSHGICPECYEELVDDGEDLRPGEYLDYP